MTNEKKIINIIKIILSLTVIYIFIKVLIAKKYVMALVSIITLIFFNLPNLIEKIFRVNFPPLLELSVCLFTFGAIIIGDIFEFYSIIPWWDDLLHFTSGFLFIAVGMFFIDIILKKNKKIYLPLILKIIISFCFTVTLLTIWECFEYGCDKLLGTDTQKDTIITKINSSELVKDNKSDSKIIDINSLYVNNNNWMNLYGGYIDIGLNDTMNDLLDGFMGALLFSIIDYFCLKNKGRKKLKNAL